MKACMYVPLLPHEYLLGQDSTSPPKRRAAQSGGLAEGGS